MSQFEDQTPAPRCWDCQHVIHDRLDHASDCSDVRGQERMVRERENDAGIIENY